MRDRFRWSLLVGFVVPVLALMLLGWVNLRRVRQVIHVTSLGQSSAVLAADPSADPGRNRLIVPEHNNDSYKWILETQQMLERREWRIRRIDFENAPFGRVANETSPYRWWLGAIAVADHRLNGTPTARAVERAALVADPLLQMLLLVGASLLVGWRFGGWAAAAVSVVMATVAPFSAEYLAGAPDDHGLVQALLIAGCLPLVIGFHAWNRKAEGAGPRRAVAWFFVAGMAGGAGMWVSIGAQVPVSVGIAIGAVAAAWWLRPALAGEPPAQGPGAGEWRAWAVGGALATLLGYLAEFAPDHLASWEMRTVHPLYALAWLGLGEIVARVVSWIQDRCPPRSAGAILALTLAMLASASPLVAIWRSHERGFLVTELSAFQLAKTAGNSGAINLWAWLVKNGVDAAAGATLLALLLLVPMFRLLARGRASRAGGAALLVLAAPIALALVQAGYQLSWWSRLDALLVVGVIAAVAGETAPLGRLGGALWAVALVPVVLGAVQLKSWAGSTTNALGERDIYSLIERDLADYLAMRSAPKPPLVLAPPDQTSAFAFYAGVRGLGTLSWANPEGLAAGVRILSASTVEEAKELVDRRGVTHIVLPSWDAYMNEYARMGMGQLETTFLERLRYWMLPPWLRPIPYQLPNIAGFEGQSVVVLEVVEDQDDAPALSRIAEYFVEMGQQDLAANASQSMRRFPADLGAVVARGQIELFRGDSAALARTIAQIKPRLSSGGDRTMLWDRRVSLAVLLARAKLPDLAREQARRCVAEATEERLRFLTPGSLYQLMVLRKVYGLEFKDEKLEAVALRLLSPEARERVAR